MEVQEGVKDPYELAQIELEKGVLPFVVVVEYPDGRMERIGV